MTYYKIVGPYCGRDRNGKFACVCGACRLLFSDDLDESCYSRNNRRHQSLDDILDRISRIEARMDVIEAQRSHIASDEDMNQAIATAISSVLNAICDKAGVEQENSPKKPL